jgi:hypothetical protein
MQANAVKIGLFDCRKTCFGNFRSDSRSFERVPTASIIGIESIKNLAQSRFASNEEFAADEQTELEIISQQIQSAIKGLITRQSGKPIKPIICE